jgi:hypothetical protein
MNRIEIVFPVDIEFDADLVKRLRVILSAICDRYEARNPDRVMWVSGYGVKAQWSKMDAAFLGLPVDSDAPESGEPTWDDSICEITISERERR